MRCTRQEGKLRKHVRHGYHESFVFHYKSFFLSPLHHRSDFRTISRSLYLFITKEVLRAICLSRFQTQAIWCMQRCRHRSIHCRWIASPPLSPSRVHETLASLLLFRKRLSRLLNPIPCGRSFSLRNIPLWFHSTREFSCPRRSSISLSAMILFSSRTAKRY